MADINSKTVRANTAGPPSDGTAADALLDDGDDDDGLVDDLASFLSAQLDTDALVGAIEATEPEAVELPIFEFDLPIGPFTLTFTGDLVAEIEHYGAETPTRTLGFVADR